ncbi:MAG: type IV pilus secretin PilQ [Terriglobia bacterium]
MSAKTIAAVSGAFILLVCMHVPAGHVTAGQAGWAPRAVPAALHSGPSVAAAPAAELPAISAAPVEVAQDLPAQLAGVSIDQTAGGAAVINIKTTEPVQFKPFILRKPARLVIDLEGAEARRPERIAPAQAGVLKDVRLAQFSVKPARVVRVVADLTAERPFQIESQPTGVRVRIDSNEIKADSSLPLRMTPKPERVAQTSVSEVCGVSSKCGSKTADLKSAGPRYSAAPAIAATARPLPAAKLIAAALTPEFPPQPVASIQPVAMETTSDAASLNSQLSQSGGIVTTPFYTKQKYTGKLISLDLRDVDIRDFFRLIHQVSGLNIVVDSDVSGKITMVMDDVPWDQALAIALKDNGLGSRLEGGVLRIAKVSTLLNEAKAQADARAVNLEAEPLVTVVRLLRYARAADLLPGQAGAMGGPQGGAPMIIPGVVTILTGLKGVISPDGKVMSDPRDNAVIITDHRSQIPIIEAVIDKLDTKSKQVSIQVRVILASADFTRTLSAVLSGAFQSARGHTGAAGGTGNGIVAIAPTSSPLPLLGAVTQPASVASTGFGAFSITTQAARYAINAAINAAESHDQARTISRPTIVTQNNVRGEVQQGVQIPIQTDINNTIAVQYVNATLQLSVTPQVTQDGKVFLNIYVNNASVGTLSTIVGPSINTQEATTQVLVPDGGTVVFGGITVTTRSRSAAYVPLIGNIPILGNLFKSSQVNDQNQELLFFVSPTILPG